MGLFLVILLGLAVALGKRRVVFAVLLTRVICDPVFGIFGLSKDGSDPGLGAALNVLVICIGLAYFIERPRAVAAVIAPIWAPFLAVSFWCVLSAPDRMVAIRFFLVQVSYCAMFAIPFSIVESDEDLYQCLIIVLFSSIIPILYAAFELVSGNGISDEAGLRVQSTFAHPNIFAFYLTLLIAIALFLMRTKALAVPSAMRRSMAFYLPIMLFFLLMTKTRSAWVACGLMLLVYSIFLDRRFFSYLFAAPIVFLTEPSLRERLLDLESGNVYEDYAVLNSYAWRKLLWQASAEWIARKPVLGHGLNSFTYYVDQFFPLPLEEGTAFDAHNVYVQLLFETGIVGLVSFLWLFFRLLLKLLGGIRRDWGLTIFITYGIAYLLVCYSDNMEYYLVFNWYFWFVMGAATAWVSNQNEPSVNRLFFAEASGEGVQMPAFAE